MVSREVLEYVKGARARGMTNAQIRTALRRAGYAPANIEKAIRPARIITTKTLAFALVGLALLILVILAGMKIFAQPKEITLLLNIQQAEANPGQAVTSTAAMSSEQSRKVPVQVVFELVQESTGKIIASRFARKEVGKGAVATVNLIVPQNAPEGTYLVSASAKYKNKEIQASQSFSVTIPEKLPEEEEKEFLEPELAECPETCDDFNPCTTDYCEQGICKHDLRADCCGNSICEAGESPATCPEDCAKKEEELSAILEKAQRTAKDNAEKAAILCNSIANTNDRDECFLTIAKTSKKSALCAQISDTRTRDSCYIDFAFELNDFSVCESISNRYMLTSCLSYANAQQPMPSQQEIAQMTQEAEISDVEV